MNDGNKKTYIKENDIMYYQYTRGFYDCTFQLEEFPFDTQTCNFTISLRKNGPKFPP